MPRTFVLNDETQVNSYGFRTLNVGIDLERFKKNPVLLDDHYNRTGSVVGKWENIRIEGVQLKADAVFDEEDDDAKKLAGKVDRGFLKGCSMGLGLRTATFDQDPKGEWVCTSCELMEASVVGVPSNANAVKLYTDYGKLASQDEIKLFLEPNSESFLKEKNMHKLQLTAIALAALGINSTEDTLQLAGAIEKLAAEKNELQVKLKALEQKAEADAKLQAELLINKAIADGKLTAEVKDAWVEMATQNLAAISQTIEGMSGKTSLRNLTQGLSTAQEVKTEEDFLKLSDADKLAFKEQHPEQYNKIFNS